MTNDYSDLDLNELLGELNKGLDRIDEAVENCLDSLDNSERCIDCGSQHIYKHINSIDVNTKAQTKEPICLRCYQDLIAD